MAGLTVTGAPAGYDAYLAAEAARRRGGLVLFVAADDAQAEAAAEAVAFFAPGLRLLPFPAWDCLPYDRVSPKPDIESARLATLAALARRRSNGPAVVVTTRQRRSCSACRRAPSIAEASFSAAAGAGGRPRRADRASSPATAMSRAGTVREPGDFALRGGIVDLWPPGHGAAAAAGFLRRDAGRHPPLRCRRRNCRTTRWRGSSFCPPAKRRSIPHAISRFRTGYVAAFGPASDDPLYESVSAGRKASGHGALAAAVL